MQTYNEYLLTMKAYNFYPMNLSLWQAWQDYYIEKWCTCKHTDPLHCVIHREVYHAKM